MKQSERVALWGLLVITILWICSLIIFFASRVKNFEPQKSKSTIGISKPVLIDSIKNDWAYDPTISRSKRRVYDYLIKER
jgi:hypothetical protein